MVAVLAPVESVASAVGSPAESSRDPQELAVTRSALVERGVWMAERLESTRAPADEIDAETTADGVDSSAIRENKVEVIRAAGVAVRAQRLSPDPSRIVSIPGGLGGRPFAPGWLHGCDQMMFYARQFGLPEHFSRVGWRESRCRNDVSNGSHYGYLQINVNLHLRDHRTGPRYRQECGINGIDDIFGNSPIQRQRQMCAGAVIYQTVGRSAWVQTW
jgi:hypothetical protein